MTSVINKRRNTNFCRICLKPNDNSVLMEEQNGWLTLFEYCFGISLTNQDEGRVLCGECADNIKKYSLFKKKCLKTNKLWKSVSVTCLITENALTKIETKYDGNNIKNFTDITLPQPTISSILSYDSDPNDADYPNNHDGDESTEIMSVNKCDSGCVTDELSIQLGGKSKTSSDQLTDNLKVNEEKAYLVELRESSLKSSVNKIVSKQKSVNNIFLSDNTNIEHNFQCRVCCKHYEKEKWYLSHIKKCPSIKLKKGTTYEQSVPKCNSRDGNRQKNFKDNHDYSCNPMLFCGLCKLSCTDTDSINKHLNEHWSSGELICKMCDFIGLDMASLISHRYIHYSPKDKFRFVCHLCKTKRKSKLALEFHYRLVHLKKKGGLCSYCQKEISDLRKWKRHEKTHGSGDFICDICGKRFNFKYEIRQHIVESHLQLQQYICDICGKIFSRSRSLKLHITSVHVTTDPVKCTHCNKMFKSQNHVDIHMKMLCKKKLYKCDVCFKEYPTKCRLISHINKHSDEKPHTCHICGAKYKREAALRVHVRNHDGYLPFSCEVCFKCFATSKQSKVHSSVHTGIRRHKCLFCVRTFYVKKQLLNHCNKCHKMEVT